MPELLLASKTHIPPLRSNLVSRVRLIQRLDDGLAQQHRLMLISAPAGYGKSTLLNDWIRQRNIPAAWLSLDPGDNEPTRFFRYFISALQSIPDLQQANIGSAFLESLQASQPTSMEVLLANLANDFSRLNEPVLLVLDDLHVITEGQIHQDLVFLIEHLVQGERGLRLVIASRMDPPWPLARWRARSELTELRTKDLRFSPQEAAAFLNQVMGVRIPAKDVEFLEQRTEGWIAGLQMAALSMQGREDIAGFLAGFSGSHRYILDYLIEEVLSQQTANILTFLLHTSILEQLSANLCDRLLERDDSQTILELLEQANLFLIPLDDERQWYRYHQLFADLLQKRLKQTQPELPGILHQRASLWYRENNYLSKAVSHALQSEDITLVNNLISGNALAMVEHVELIGVLRQFEKIPDEQITSKPWLCVAHAWVQAYVDPARGMDLVMRKAMESVAAVEDDLEKQHLTSHLDAVWAYVAWINGKASLALEFAHEALKHLPDDDRTTRTHVLNIKGLALQFDNEISEAVLAFEAAVAAGQITGQPFESFNAYTNWAYAEILQGHLKRAFSICQQVLDLAEQSGLITRRLPVLAYAYATMSVVQSEWNQVEAAVASARQAVTLAERWGQADTMHYSLTCLSQAFYASGDLEAALAVNQRAMQLAVHVSPWFVQISINGEILIDLAKGEVNTAAQKFRELERSVNERSKQGLFLISQVALLNAQGRFADTIDAIGQVIDELERRGRIWSVLTLMTYLAVALQAQGEEEKAIQVIGRCLAIAQPEGYQRIFLGRGAPMQKLLRSAMKCGLATEYIQELLPAFHLPGAQPMPESPAARPAPAKTAVSTMLEPLSEREIQVLRLLDSPLTSVDIGRELYISTNTVRTHIKNIYAKLGVNRRTEAVRLAKEIELI